MNEVNELFTKENVEKIYVPDIVKDDLLSIIEEKLKKAGFYYRVAYRVKAPDSMLDKLILKDYRRPGTDNQDKKMQDLIGIRIILYYADDVEIVVADAAHVLFDFTDAVIGVEPVHGSEHERFVFVHSDSLFLACSYAP